MAGSNRQADLKFRAFAEQQYRILLVGNIDLFSGAASPIRMKRQGVLFRDRTDAGKQLAAALQADPPPASTVLLALPRGGVPVGVALSQVLSLPLEPLVVRKLGVPHFPEFAMGALAAGGHCLVDRALQQRLGLSDAAVDAVIRHEQSEMQRREREYPISVPLPALKDRPVIVVDDGMATGSTVLAALMALRAVGVGTVTVVVPVASVDAAGRVRAQGGRVLALACPEPFGSVGQWYGDFRQLDDDCARALLAQAQRLPAAEVSAGSIPSH